jgi:DNA repair exonuclease SbcCD nuclease subunit
MLCGNHDQSSKIGNIHSLEPFREFAIVVDDLSSALGLVYMPFCNDEPVLIEFLKRLSCVEILFMHQPVAEAIPGPTDNPGKPDFCLEDIPFDRVKLVVSGHIHKRQWLAGGKFHYLGSPLQLNFGEEGEEKCFSIIDTETLEIESVPTNAPTFHRVMALDDDIDPRGVDFGGVLNAKRNFIKLIYSDKWAKEAQYLKEEYPRIILEKQKQEITTPQRVTNGLDGNDRDLLSAYLEANPSDGLDNERLLQVGLGFLEQASNEG